LGAGIDHVGRNTSSWALQTPDESIGSSLCLEAEPIRIDLERPIELEPFADGDFHWLSLNGCFHNASTVLS
jgi:hypothetical protein